MTEKPMPSFGGIIGSLLGGIMAGSMKKESDKEMEDYYVASNVPELMKILGQELKDKDNELLNRCTRNTRLRQSVDNKERLLEDAYGRIAELSKEIVALKKTQKKK